MRKYAHLQPSSPALLASRYPDQKPEYKRVRLDSVLSHSWKIIQLEQIFFCNPDPNQGNSIIMSGKQGKQVTNTGRFFSLILELFIFWIYFFRHQQPGQRLSRLQRRRLRLQEPLDLGRQGSVQLLLQHRIRSCLLREQVRRLRLPREPEPGLSQLLQQEVDGDDRRRSRSPEITADLCITLFLFPKF